MRHTPPTPSSCADMYCTDAIAIFFNSLGGAISISIAQNIFSNTLIQEIPKHTNGLNPVLIISAGATHVREVTPPNQLAGVLQAYDLAVQKAFILPIAVGAIAFLFSLLVSHVRDDHGLWESRLTYMLDGVEECKGKEAPCCWRRMSITCSNGHPPHRRRLCIQ